jgi:hypothetical protein
MPVRRPLVPACSALALIASLTVPIAAAGPASAATCSQAYLPLPDANCQPGAFNPAVTQATIHSTICMSGYGSRIRPPMSYTNALKRRQIAEYGYGDTNPAHYEEDHLINLSLGGDPRSPLNLWPEPRAAAGGRTAADKDDVEFKLYRAVCDGRVLLDPARRAIARDWTTALAEVGLS